MRVGSGAALSAEARTAAETVVGLFQRAPSGPPELLELGALLDRTPTVVGRARDAERLARGEDRADSLRAHASELRRLAAGLARADSSTTHAPAAGVLAARMKELAADLEQTAAAPRGDDRADRLDAVLARLRDGDWSNGVHSDTPLEPTHRWYLGSDLVDEGEPPEPIEDIESSASVAQP